MANANSANSSVLNKWLNDKDFYSDENLNNENKLIKKGEGIALKLFHQASKRVPAYKDFLHQNGIDPKLIKTPTDFKTKVPSTNKVNYIEKYPMEDRVWGGTLKNMHIVSTSSGTTGEPHFWPRDIQNEIEGATNHEFIFKDLMKVNKQKTLLLNGFAMGNWIAGTFTLACAQMVAWKNYPLTVMTPGYSTEEMLKILGHPFIKNFDQIIITGHVPFLKELVEEMVTNFNLKDFPKIILMGTGQSITENWRDYIINLLQAKDVYHTVLNVYGSADAALMGFETPSSISIRRLLGNNQSKSIDIFKDERLPSLYNYDPRLIYFEEENGELVITKNYGCPLIRYNIHDNGGVFQHSHLLSKFNEHESDSLEITSWKLPFVYLYGREKFMVKIYGANVYTEHAQSAFNHHDLQPHITGRFILESNYDDNQNPMLICRVELKMNFNKSQKELSRLIKQVFIREVSRLNSEYKFVLKEIGEQVHPVIKLYEYGHPEYFPIGKLKKTS